MMILNEIEPEQPPFYRDEELDRRAGIAILDNIAKRLFDEIMASWTAKDKELEDALSDAFFMVNQRIDWLKNDITI